MLKLIIENRDLNSFVIFELPASKGISHKDSDSLRHMIINSPRNQTSYSKHSGISDLLITYDLILTLLRNSMEFHQHVLSRDPYIVHQKIPVILAIISYFRTNVSYLDSR